MKTLLNSRGVKMLLHLVSISIFSVPITTHILKLALDESFSINGYEFTRLDSKLLIGSILLIISANIISIMADKWHKISMLLTGGFLLAVTIIQIGVIADNISMEVFGSKWPCNISVIEAWITGTFSGILLLTAVFTRHEGLPKLKAIASPKLSFPGLFEFIKKYQEKIREMEPKSAFLLGILGSFIMVIPFCILMYLGAYLFLGESIMTGQRLRLLAWIGIVGMQGSIISMFFALRRFDTTNNNVDALGLFLNALVRPFIGLSFAHLSFFMLESGLLQYISLSEVTNGSTVDSLDAEKLIYSFNYHVSVAFIAGFTERIAKVIQPGKGEAVQSKPKNNSVEDIANQGEQHKKTDDTENVD